MKILSFYSFVSNKLEIQTDIEILKKDCIVIQDDTIDLNIELKFNLDITKEQEISLIEKVEETEKKKEDRYSIVIYYTKTGDTLWKIAKQFGSTVEEIIKINEIENPDILLQGEQLFIPR